jgi:hypothetical protein
MKYKYNVFNCNRSHIFLFYARKTLGLMILLIALAILWSAPAAIAQESYPGNQAGAEKLLKQFLKPGADLHTLTLKLKPSSEDYQVIYKQPLAGNLEKAHKLMWENPRIKVAPKRGQTELVLVVTTTDALIAKDKTLRMFPGGYQRVLSHMKSGFPIARFKFVQSGEKLGMAFDGLVYVNGRWVFIPKPWRVLN